MLGFMWIWCSFENAFYVYFRQIYNISSMQFAKKMLAYKNVLLLLSTGMDNNLNYTWWLLVYLLTFHVIVRGIYDCIQLFKICHDLYNHFWTTAHLKDKYLESWIGINLPTINTIFYIESNKWFHIATFLKQGTV